MHGIFCTTSVLKVSRSAIYFDKMQHSINSIIYKTKTTYRLFQYPSKHNGENGESMLD